MRKGVRVHIDVYEPDDSPSAFLTSDEVMTILIDAFEAHGLVIGGSTREVDLDEVVDL